MPFAEPFGGKPHRRSCRCADTLSRRVFTSCRAVVIRQHDQVHRQAWSAEPGDRSGSPEFLWHTEIRSVFAVRT